MRQTEPNLNLTAAETAAMDGTHPVKDAVQHFCPSSLLHPLCCNAVDKHKA